MCRLITSDSASPAPGEIPARYPSRAGIIFWPPSRGRGPRILCNKSARTAMVAIRPRCGRKLKYCGQGLKTQELGEAAAAADHLPPSGLALGVLDSGHCEHIGPTDRCWFSTEEVSARSQATMPRQPLSRCLVIWSG